MHAHVVRVCVCMYLHVCVIGGACVRMCVRMWRVSQGQRQHITGVWPWKTSRRQGQRGAQCHVRAPSATARARLLLQSARGNAANTRPQTHANFPLPPPPSRPVRARTRKRCLQERRRATDPRIHIASKFGLTACMPPLRGSDTRHAASAACASHPVFTQPRLHATPMAGRRATTTRPAWPRPVRPLPV